MLNGVVVHFMYKQFGFSEVKVDFWMQSIEETIGKAKKEVGEERARQYEEEGIAMGKNFNLTIMEKKQKSHV